VLRVRYRPVGGAQGARHNPVAREECLVMLVERESTLHTGDLVDARTRSPAEQLRPVGQE
jgi:hypothetical protein